MAKDTVECTASISIGHLNRQGHIDDLKKHWANVENAALRVSIGDVTEDIKFDTTNGHFGGKRWWFFCTGCGKRAGVLYRPLGSRRILCRKCHNLTYDLCHDHGSSLEWMARWVHFRVKVDELLASKPPRYKFWGRRRQERFERLLAKGNIRL